MMLAKESIQNTGVYNSNQLVPKAKNVGIGDFIQFVLDVNERRSRFQT